MSEALQLIVDSLNKPPFALGTSIISFDSFPEHRLLQTVSDVLRFPPLQGIPLIGFSWITQSDPVDISRETADDTAVRLLQKLRIINFKPPRGAEEMETWRAGLIEGRKQSVYPVLSYVFSNVDALKERSYLAKFLMKVEVPSEIHDIDIENLQHELGQLREQFKEVHNRVVTIREETLLLDEIKLDLKTMDQEKEALSHKIDKAERRVQSLPQLDKFMNSAAGLRTEKERIAELDIQRQRERDSLIHLEQSVQRMRNQLNELRTAGENIDPSHMIEQLEDEIATNSYMAQTKLSSEIEEKRQAVFELQKISDLPAINQTDIQNLQHQIGEMGEKVKRLEEERDRAEEGYEENISVFRHQAAAVERKKLAAAQRLQEARQELAQYEARVELKKKEIRSRSGVDVISGREFRDYANSVRERGLQYKKRRRVMDELIAERDTVRLTMERLAKKFGMLRERIQSMGGEVMEDLEIRVPERPKTAAPRTDNVAELRNLIQQLMADLDRKKDEVEPLKRQKDQRQTKFNELNDMVRERRAMYERRKEQLEQSAVDLKQEVVELEQRKVQAEEGVLRIRDKMRKMEESADELDKGGEAFLEKLQEQLRGLEAESEQLRRKDAGPMDPEYARQQVVMYRGLLTMFETKIALARETL